MAKIYKKRWELSTRILEKDLLEVKKKTRQSSASSSETIVLHI